MFQVSLRGKRGGSLVADSLFAVTELLDALSFEFGGFALARMSQLTLLPSEGALLTRTAPFLKEVGTCGRVPSLVVLLQLAVFRSHSPWKHICYGRRLEFESSGVI